MFLEMIVPSFPVTPHYVKMHEINGLQNDWCLFFPTCFISKLEEADDRWKIAELRSSLVQTQLGKRQFRLFHLEGM